MYWIVMNRSAGNGRGGDAWARLEPMLKRRMIAYRMLPSSDAAQADAAIRRCLAEADRPAALVVIGGDGTVHGILEAAADCAIPVGIIPAGSGNDLARSLGIPEDVGEAWDVIRNGRPGAMDLLAAGGKLCVNIAGVGLDAEVAHRTERSVLKGWLNRFRLGQAAYVANLLKALLTFRPESVIMTLDGRTVRLERVWLIAAANLPHYGGGMRICPSARSNDGTIDICVVSGVTRAGLLLAFPKVYRGAHMDHPAVSFYRAQRVRIEPANPDRRAPLRAHGDGEPLGTAPLEMSVRRRQLQIIATERSRTACTY